MPKWDAKEYLKFGDERTQPVRDLVGRIEIAHPRRIIDLGCGPGNSTEVLRRRWPNAEIVGLDNSEEMIQAAAGAYPQGKWVSADIGSWSADAPFDIIFSNAALHWVPDHARLFPRLLSQLAPGGVLAVQIPAHHRSRLHHLIREVAEDPRWRHLLMKAANAMTREPPSFYFDLLEPLTSRLSIWETDYYHLLESHSSLLEWFRATGLRPYLDVLEDDRQRQRFEEKLAEVFTQSIPPRHDGRVLFAFPRLFILAAPAASPAVRNHGTSRRPAGSRLEG